MEKDKDNHRRKGDSGKKFDNSRKHNSKPKKKKANHGSPCKYGLHCKRDERECRTKDSSYTDEDSYFPTCMKTSKIVVGRRNGLPPPQSLESTNYSLVEVKNYFDDLL